MGDSYGDPQKGRSFNNSRDTGRGGFRGNRASNNREMGGFRIRLSDNEMNAARKIQEVFNLRSTVAVLGFSVRTLGQMLEEGKLADFITEYQSKTSEQGSNSSRTFKGGRTSDSSQGKNDFKNKPNPFARPEKPISNQNENDELTKDQVADSEELKVNASEDNNQINKKDENSDES